MHGRRSNGEGVQRRKGQNHENNLLSSDNSQPGRDIIWLFYHGRGKKNVIVERKNNRTPRILKIK